MSKATEYKNKYIAANYDRINLTVPKGNKALIEARAKELGLSINGYINQLLRQDMDTEAAAPAPEKQEASKKGNGGLPVLACFTRLQYCSIYFRRPSR